MLQQTPMFSFAYIRRTEGQSLTARGRLKVAPTNSNEEFFCL